MTKAALMTRLFQSNVNGGNVPIGDLMQFLSMLFAGFAVVVAWVQIGRAHKQLKANHEYERRKFAITLLSQLDQMQDDGHGLARLATLELNKEQAQSLIDRGPFKVSRKRSSALCIFLNKNTNAERDELEVTESESIKLRAKAVQYFNMLETIFAAARHNVASDVIIFEQFTDAIITRDLGRNEFLAALKTSYPAIHWAIDRVTPKQSLPLPATA